MPMHSEPTQITPPKAAGSGEWLVVIDRLEASVFRSVAAGAVPQLIRSHLPDHEVPSRPAAKTGGNGRDQFRRPGFFEPLAGVLHGAGRILIFGSATTLGGEAEQFVAWLRGYRPAIAERIVASVPVQSDECSEAGLLAMARDLYQRLTAVDSESCRSPGAAERSS